MIFSSYGFFFIFLPTVFITYFTLNRFKFYSAAKWWLVLSSLFFYAYASISFFPFFVGSVLINYGIGLLLSKYHGFKISKTRKLILIIGIIENIVLLGYYKYMDFFITNINWLTGNNMPLIKIVLPIGISFFTFQLIAYLVDSYRGETKEYSLQNYLLFITFFPQLIVGPIVHHKDVVPQYQNKKIRKINFENLSTGLLMFAMGCAKKLIIADPLTRWAKLGFDNSELMNMLTSWTSSLSYTLSYYFDLSGYADMAIGLGLMFNIMIPKNFNSPYKSRNFAQYWSRWHITLSKFLGDYIFRSMHKKGDKAIKVFYAIFITFLVSGFWHGAGWNFVVWGVLNGIFVIFAHMMIRSKKSLPYFLAWCITFLGIVITRIFFVSKSVKHAVNITIKLVDISSLTSYAFNKISLEQIFYIIVGLIIVFFLPNSHYFREKFKPNLKFAFFVAVLLILAILHMDKVADFLYFQF